MKRDTRITSRRWMVRGLFAAVLMGALGCGTAPAGSEEARPTTDPSASELALTWTHGPLSCQHFASFDVPGGSDTEG
ncbi:MAG: hypothetical protein ACXWLS_09280, partial [Myxococcaceae bacterium]